MKTKLLIVPFLLMTGMVWGQVKVDAEKKIIDINATTKSVNIIVDKGEYILNIEGTKSFSIKKGARYYDALSVDKIGTTGNPIAGTVSSLKLKFGSNTEYIITAITNDTTPEERQYIIKSQSDWEWSTTLGANAVVFMNRSKFVSKETNGSYSVAEIQDRKSMELMPAIMFTLMNKQENFSFGYTGGIGFNFEELALFTGLSLGIGQNIVLTGGVAVHKQHRPNSDYSIGHVIENTVTAEDLNKQQYRFNPFIGISFRFDNNPFKSNNN